MAQALPLVISGPAGVRLYAGRAAPAVLSGGLTEGDDLASGSLTSAAPPAPAPSPASAANLMQGPLRQAQTNYLFQRVTALELPVPPVMSGSGVDPLRLDVWGPTATVVDPATGWLWQNSGGDWLDATNTRQGTTPWFSVATNSGSGSSYSVDCTVLAKEVFLQRLHFAIALNRSSGGGARDIAGQFNSNSALRPAVDVVYMSGATFTASSGETPGNWIGVWADMTLADPTEPDQYNWTAAGGATLPNFTNAIPYRDSTANNAVAYIHGAYATSADGSTGFNRTSGTYIGTYADNTQANSSSPGAYTWRLVSGLTASQGVPCVNSVTSTTGYLHWKFSDDGGRTETLACNVSAQNTVSSAYPNTTGQAITMPVFLEFDKPTDPVRKATLRFAVVTQYSGNCNAEGYLLAPVRNSAPYTEGICASRAAYDADLASDPSIIGTLQFPDGTTLADVTPASVPGATSSESSFSPEFFTAGGAVDTSKFPYVGHSKLLNSTSPQGSISVVNSSYTGEGFAPLFPGMGALRLHMPALSLTDGESYDELGQTVSAMTVMMPPAHFGTLSHIFVRWYQRLGTNLVPDPTTRKCVTAGGVPQWNTKTGKWGIMPSAANSYGGFSGTAGGGWGWQFRWEYAVVDAGVPGPINGAMMAKLHMYDYLSRQPAGYDYGNQDQNQFRFGSLGGALYPGAWYCCEAELQLNSTTTGAPGYIADGLSRAWIDGRLVFEKTGMVVRSKPVESISYSPSNLRPTLELGITHLDLNFFEGGKTRAPDARTLFYAAIAWGTSRIGCINTRPADSWLPAAGDAALIGYASGAHPSGLAATMNNIDPSADAAKNPLHPSAGPWTGAPNYGPYVWNTYPGYITAAYDPVNRRAYFTGSGHNGTTVSQSPVHDVATRAWSWAGPVIPEDAWARLQGHTTSEVTTDTIKACYPEAEFDPTEMAWLGASRTWGTSFKQQGHIFPLTGHTWFGSAWVPGHIWGNRNGAIMLSSTNSGILTSNNTTTIKRLALNLDTAKWEVTRNKRSREGGIGAGTLYHRTAGVYFSFTTYLSAFRSDIDILRSKDEGWLSRTSTNSIYCNVSSGLAEFANLLLYFQATDYSGAIVASPTACKVWAVDATAAQTNGFTWSALNVSGTWPLTFVGKTEENGWVYFKKTGKLYAVDGRTDSTTLYVLSPPVGWTDTASLLAGTWTITTESLAHALGSRNTGAANGFWQIYNRLVDDGNSLLLYDADVTNRNPIAIRPAGA